MTSKDTAGVEGETLAAYLAGDLSQPEVARIEAVLRDDPAARARLAELQRIREALSGPVHELEGVDLVEGVRRALRRQAPPRADRRWGWLAMAAAALSALAIVVVLRAPAARDSEFRARSAASAMDGPARWAAVKIYRVQDGAAPQPLGARLTRSDGLLFGYTNLGKAPFDYVMVFAVGPGGQVYWFHPAYEKLGENPTSTPIEHGKADVMLKQVVRHDYLVGPLSIYALFSREPFTVLEIEGWLARQSGAPTTPPASGASLQHFTVAVEP